VASKTSRKPDTTSTNSLKRLKPTDPYPTWPFTIVEPSDLEQWCKKNVRRVKEDAKQYEEAPW
jgi:hypothetical protein